MEAAPRKNLIFSTTDQILETLNRSELNNIEMMMVIIEVLTSLLIVADNNMGRGDTLNLLDKVYNISKDNLIDNKS